MIAHLDIATKEGAVGDDDMISEPTIVSHVRAGHQKIVAPNDRRRSWRRAPVNLNILAKNIVACNS